MNEMITYFIDRETALADFDHARDDFELALRLVPDEALEYKPEGDDYSIADLVPHVTGSIMDYARQLDLTREMEFRVVRLVAQSEGAILIEEGRREREDRTPREGHENALAQMESAHDR